MDDILRYASGVADALGGVPGVDLVGAYLHGSVAMGGFHAATSDIDLLAIVGGPTTAEVQRRMAEAMLTAVLPCPGQGLEASVITTRTAATGDRRFEVHVTADGDRQRVVIGFDHPGDADLPLYAAVCRQHALGVTGPPPGEVFGVIPRLIIVEALTRELRWSLTDAEWHYAVLNACRALRYVEEGVLCSKMDGGRWLVGRQPNQSVVFEAMARQASPLAPAADHQAVLRLLTGVINRLQAAS